MRALLFHLFIPHHTNNHRAKLLHIDSYLVYIALILAFQLITQSVHRSFPEVLGYATDIYVEQLLSGTNAKRQEAGLTILTLNQQLSQAAASKGQDMFAKGYWAHYAPDGKTPWDFIIGSGYRYTVAGENLAKNFNDSGGVVGAWMASQSHRENIMKPSYREVGFAVVNGVLNGEETTLVVQMFGARQSGIAGATKKIPTSVPTQIPTKAAVALGQSVIDQKVEVPLVSKETEPVTVSGVAPPDELDTESTSPLAFASVSKKPIFDITKLTRDGVTVVLGILMVVLVLDAWIVARRHVVRAAGHNIAHFLFFGAVLLVIVRITPGVIL